MIACVSSVAVAMIVFGVVICVVVIALLRFLEHMERIDRDARSTDDGESGMRTEGNRWS